LPEITGIARLGINGQHDYPCFDDVEGHAAQRYGADHIYLIRPDGHICAAFRSAKPKEIQAAYDRARGINA
jgi:3-(3-hydroxy-phenyl)propionate hydroxylase